MARNADYSLKRTQLIESAHRKIGVLPTSGLTPEMRATGIELLNLILREESGRGAGLGAPQLWAQTESVLFMQANRSRYNVAQSGVAGGIVDLSSAVYRDSSGDDVSIDIVTAKTYAEIADKNETGEPEILFLKRHTDLALQELWVWRLLSGPATGNRVSAI